MRQKNVAREATCCAVDYEDVEDDVVGVHGDDCLAVEGVTKGSECHDLVQTFAEFLMRRVLQFSTRGQR